jgi:hypothetical protein
MKSEYSYIGAPPLLNIFYEIELLCRLIYFISEIHKSATMFFFHGSEEHNLFIHPQTIFLLILTISQ